MRKAILLIVIALAIQASVSPATIVVGKGAPALEQLAAKELQKYLYAATGELLPILR